MTKGFARWFLLGLLLLSNSMGASAATFGEAVEQPSLTFETGGNSSWFVTNIGAFDNVDAIASGAIEDQQETWIQAAVTGPVKVKFKWKVSSEQDYDELQVLVDGVLGQAISGETGWIDGNIIVPEGTHMVRWRYFRDDTVFAGDDRGWVDQITTEPLADLLTGLDATGMTFSADLWYGVTDPTHDGVDAAQTGAIGHSGQASLQMQVTGPGTVTFWWKVSSEQDYDLLKLFLDTRRIASISGELDWAFKSISIPTGVHTVTWTYSKDAETSVGFDAGWVDQIGFSDAVDLTTALDDAGIAWNTGGTAPWAGQGIVTHDSQDAAGSGPISNSQESWIEATITGPIQLAFWWKLSSELNFDFLNFLVDGAVVERVSGEVDWAQKIVSLPPGAHTVRWQFVKDSSGGAGEDKAWLDQVALIPPIPLGDALEQPALTWTSGGSAIWLGEVTDSRDGTDAAKAGAIAHSQESWLETNVSGPTTLSFWWKASCETNFDTLTILIDGAAHKSISGEVDWRVETFEIPTGAHVIRWRYRKDASTSRGRDTVWLDLVSTVGNGAGPKFAGLQIDAGELSMTIENLTAGTNFVIESSTDLRIWTPLATNSPSGATMPFRRPLANSHEFLRARVGEATAGTAPAALALLHVEVTTGSYAGLIYDINFTGTGAGTFTETGDFDGSGVFTYSPLGGTATLRLNYSTPPGDFDEMTLTFATNSNGSFSGTVSASGSVRPFSGTFSSVAR